MSLKIRGFLVIAIGTTMGLALSLGGQWRADRAAQESRGPGLSEEQSQQIAEVMDRVRAEYVEPIDDDTLIEGAIRGIVGTLDQHSQYLGPKEYEDIRISATGSYTGVGLEVGVRDAAVTVLAPMQDSPAGKAGLQAGDIIVMVDDKAIEAGDLPGAVASLRGRPGSDVEIVVSRPGEDELRTIRVTREHIRLSSVQAELLDKSVAYLSVRQFNDETARDISGEIEKLRVDAPSITGAVLDMRNNPGGVLESAVAVSDLFLDSGVIVSGAGRNSGSRFEYDAHDGDILYGIPIVVLVNNQSASAAEIVAGALQDHHRATIVGTQTYGKGVVQTVMPLTRGRAIKLTTSQYMTPSGARINGTGITPDVVVNDDRAHPYHAILSQADTNNDPQLLEALRQLQSLRLVRSDTE
jgi:carboxyl-terminal processing protease